MVGHQRVQKSRPPPPLNSAQGARQGKTKSVNAGGQGAEGWGALQHTFWGCSGATEMSTCAKNGPVAGGGHLGKPEMSVVQRHARGALRGWRQCGQAVPS